MSFIEIAKKRYSVRKYKNKPVEEYKIKQVLEAGRIAPSAVNYQPWYFIVVRDKKKHDDVASFYHRDWFKKAPVIIIICGDHKQAWKRADGKDYCDIDVAIAIDHMTLTAADIGLGTCWVCNFDSIKCSEYFKLPPYIEPIAMLPLGYPEDKADINRFSSKRKDLDNIVHWEIFNQYKI
ncbi:MAG: nitroreductase family protein [Bacteroidales bacterium]|nr:nitroreductase family protein [Bacteroidales bacterium]